MTPQYILRASLCRVVAPGERRRAESEIECLAWYDDYAEPGYSAERHGVLAANWNPFPDDVVSLLEKAGFSIEWSDEWTECVGCNKAVRTVADSYGWRRSYLETDDGALCQACAREEPDTVLDQIMNNPRAALTFDLGDLGELGFVKLMGDLESGLHPGQDADPALIARQLRAAGVDRYFFQIDSVGQFDLDFSVWVDRDQLDRIPHTVETQGYSPSQACQAALKDASAKMAQLSGPGIKYAVCKADGTADVRLVSREEFIAGIKP